MNDDGSTDNSGIICDEYAKKDTRIRVIHQENKGVSDSWNEALKQVKGEYTGFVDGDDLIHPRMYELLYQSIQKTQCDMAYCDYRSFYGDGDFDFESIGNDPDEDGNVRVSLSKKEMVDNVDFPAIWRGLYKTDLIKDISFLSKRNGQDLFWSSCVLLKVDSVARVDKILYAWRKRAGSESYLANRYRILDYLDVRRVTVEYMKENAPEWLVLYACDMFKYCLDTANRISLLTDPAEKERYRTELNRALDTFAGITISDIIKDPHLRLRRKITTLSGRISFPFTCFIKKNILIIVDRLA